MRQFQSQEEVDQFVNEMRQERGLDPLPDGYHVVQIVEGMFTGCGCQVGSVRPGSHFTIYHHDDCRIVNPHLHRREVVKCTSEGQAVCGTLDPDTKAVMRLDLPWPHEL
ncbi:MAG TPA: hypothetical protein VM537_16425 [Anaerolineae bacterium]|nr:hypothetical protein [Anaerolineae bacterium]